MKKVSFILLPLFVFYSCTTRLKESSIDLSGTWAFSIDPKDEGIRDKWSTKILPDTIHLPGSMTTNNKGDEVGLYTPWTGQIVDSSFFRSPEYAKFRKEGNFKVPFWLQPVKYYKGAAWYQKEVHIPAGWDHRHIELFLERCHWETKLWVDTIFVGMQNALGAPHVYDLTEFINPGVHILTICIDNRTKLIDVGMNSHSITDHTQGNWNGMIGKLELRSKPQVFIDAIKVFPDVAKKNVKIYVTIRNQSEKMMDVFLKIQAKLNNSGKPLSSITKQFHIEIGEREVELDYSMGDTFSMWDEFHPDLYTLSAKLSSGATGTDQVTMEFGMRKLEVGNSHFMLNGRPIFLRGTLECAIFPKTGYPPTDTTEWMRIFRIARSHGLNEMRFHSWCPPEAAFAAADRMGFYLHVECSSWANSGASIGDGKPIDQFIYDESERIVRAFGNHPSFCFLLYGNEPAGVNQNRWLGDFVNYWKAKDNRRLYSSGAGWPAIPENDFHSSPVPRIQQWGEGLKSIINSEPPSADYDWGDRLKQFDRLVVSHEIGQWCVYPDFKEMNQYTGVLKPKNFEIFKESLSRSGMGSLADQFVQASGKLQTLCYKAEIEAALRSPGFGGFELLDLHDFPGQGTALVGVLNPFWNEKGYVSPEEYRRFCGPVVPLVRLKKMVYLNTDTLLATAEVANFGDRVLLNPQASWKLVDQENHLLAGARFSMRELDFGEKQFLGNIAVRFSRIERPVQLKLIVRVNSYENHWDLWVYPANLPNNNGQVMVTRELNTQTIQLLRKGGKVLLTPVKGKLKPEKGGNIAIGFSSIFWNTAWTNKQAPQTLGILCDPKHPALAEFPTESHSNWQWWDAMSHSNAIVLSDLPEELNPIVRVIDDWFTNHPLGLIFEVKVGKGKLLVTGIDLLSDTQNRPEARQLMHSLLEYMNSGEFNPGVEVGLKTLKGLYIE